VAGWRLRLSWRWNGRGAFYGGVFLPTEKERTEDRPIELLPIPRRLYVPLRAPDGRCADPCVQVGQTVRCGELIARASGPDAVPVHASADGVVRALIPWDTPYAPEVPCVEIETHRAAVPHVASAPAVSHLDDLISQVAAAGVVEYGYPGSEGVPTAARLASAARGCACLIINAMESDPCVTADWRLLVERTDDILNGGRRLAEFLGVREVWLAIDRSKHRMVSHLVARSEKHTHEQGSDRSGTAAGAGEGPGRRVRIAPLVNKYPQGHPALLVKAICGKEIPHGGDDLSVGALVIGAGAVAAIESFLRSGMPVTQRLVTVTGEAVERPGNYLVAVGTPVRDVIGHVGVRQPPCTVVVGSPMTGTAIRRMETVVTKCTTAILLMTIRDGPGASYLAAVPPGTCTRCGWCLEDCPVGLDPASLLSAVERRDLARAARLHARVCIQCGLCSYVCPARLPLSESIRAVRGEAVVRVPGFGGQGAGPGGHGLEGGAEAQKTAAPEPCHTADETVETRKAHAGEQWHTGVSPRLLRAGPSPHWRGVETAAAATWTWIAAASLPAAASVVFFGTSALALLAITIAAALLVEKVLSAVLFRAETGGTASGRGEAQALLTGLLVALTLPPDVLAAGWYIPITAVLIATLVGQKLLGGHGNHLWHPAALGRVAVELLFGSSLAHTAAPVSPTGAEAPFTAVGALVALASGDLRFTEVGRSLLTVAIRDYLPPWGMMLLSADGAGSAGASPGGAGVLIGGPVVILIVAALILGWRGHVRGWCIASAIAAAAGAAFVLPIQQGGRLIWFPGRIFDEGLPVGLAYVLHHLTAGELMLVVLLLAGDSVTSPLTSRGQRWFGAGVGALAIALRLHGLAATAGYWALLAMNTLVPLIDRWTKRRVYGT